MAIQNNFPNIQPTLNLSFALTKALDPRVSFARASAATYYGTETAKAEENLFLRSQELDNAAWTVTRASITANATTAPDGTTTAEKLVEDSTAANTHSVQQAVTLTANTHAVSVFAKKSEKNLLSISTFLSTAARTFFDLDAGTVGTTAAGHTASMVDVGNGWYRCIVVFTATAASWSMRFEIAEADNDVTIDGNGTDGIFLWGCQLEQRSAVTAYTPTTTQPITNYIPVLESAASGEARFDHNPNTFESLGLLIEEQRTNLVLRSEEFDNAGWGKTNGTVVANTVVAPDGALTGDAFIENTDAGNHQVAQAVSVTSGLTYVLSVYAKAASTRQLNFIVANTHFTTTPQAIFNLQTGVVVSSSSGTASIVPVGNGWYRCVLVTVAATSTGTNAFNLRLHDGASNSYTGDGFSGIFIWGASLEQGAFPASYIPTTTAQVTRAADAASITGANFSSWYSQGEGTLFAEVAYFGGLIGAAASTNVLSINDGSNTNIILMRTVRAPLQPQADVQVITNAVTQLDSAGFLPVVANTVYKRAFAYATNNAQAAISGGFDGDVDTSFIAPATNRFDLPSANVGMYARKIAFYPKRLSNAEIQSLTS